MSTNKPFGNLTNATRGPDTGTANEFNNITTQQQIIDSSRTRWQPIPDTSLSLKRKWGAATLELRTEIIYTFHGQQRRLRIRMHRQQSTDACKDVLLYRHHGGKLTT